MIAWLAGEEETHVISVRERQNRRVTMTARRRPAMYLVNLGLLPLLPLAARLIQFRRSCRQSPESEIRCHIPGGASRVPPQRGSRVGDPGLAALLLPQILPVFSVVAPCDPGAALRTMCHRISDSGH